MARPKIHIFCSKDPLVPGGSLVCDCGEPITKSFIVTQIFEHDKDKEKPWQMHNDCWFSIWKGRYVYEVCEADAVPDLLLESVEGK